MIQKARFQNFKSLRDVTIEFDSRLTVLVGPNGSGKTSVLQGLDSLLNRTNALVESCTIGADSVGGRVEGRNLSGVEYSLSLLKNVFSSTGNTFDCSALFRFVPTALCKPTPITTNRFPPVIGSAGEGLANVLNVLKTTEDPKLSKIISSLSSVIPHVQNIRTDYASAGSVAAPRLLIDFDYARGVQAELLSSGTLIALGILTAVMGPSPYNVLLIDELDHGLHPKAQSELMGVLQKLIATAPDIQIIGTTHSLYLLHHLEANQVRLMYTLPDGSATCGRLEWHEDYERWKERMTPGEFWGHVGEDWLLKKAATVAA